MLQRSRTKCPTAVARQVSSNLWFCGILLQRNDLYCWETPFQDKNSGHLNNFLVLTGDRVWQERGGRQSRSVWGGDVHAASSPVSVWWVCVRLQHSENQYPTGVGREGHRRCARWVDEEKGSFLWGGTFAANIITQVLFCAGWVKPAGGILNSCLCQGCLEFLPWKVQVWSALRLLKPIFYLCQFRLRIWLSSSCWQSHLWGFIDFCVLFDKSAIPVSHRSADWKHGHATLLEPHWARLQICSKLLLSHWPEGKNCHSLFLILTLNKFFANKFEICCSMANERVWIPKNGKTLWWNFIVLSCSSDSMASTRGYRWKITNKPSISTTMSS